MMINKTWAMPNKWTFTIKPVKSIVEKYVDKGEGWLDPFAGEHSPAQYTNDIDPNRRAQYHMHAKDFIEGLTGQYLGCLFDPPYSTRQAKECYDQIGLKMDMRDSQAFPNYLKDMIAPKIKTGGHVICFGWNSNGFGKKRGFEMKEILLIAHGGMHHDTIVTVEEKLTAQENLI